MQGLTLALETAHLWLLELHRRFGGREQSSRFFFLVRGKLAQREAELDEDVVRIGHVDRDAPAVIHLENVVAASRNMLPLGVEIGTIVRTERDVIHPVGKSESA